VLVFQGVDRIRDSVAEKYAFPASFKNNTREKSRFSTEKPKRGIKGICGIYGGTEAPQNPVGEYPPVKR